MQSMDVVRKLFDGARDASLGLASRLDLTREELDQIATDAVVQVRIRQEFVKLNDPDVAELVLAYLEVAADALEEDAKSARNAVDALEWTFGFGSKLLPIIGAAAAVASLVATTGLAGSLVALVAGVISLVGAGLVRYHLTNTALKNQTGAERIRRLVENVRKA
jgi:hypothetical protein